MICKFMKDKKYRAVNIALAACFFMIPFLCKGQMKWVNMDIHYQPLPSSVHVYKTTDSLEGKPFIAYYLEAGLKDQQLDFTDDTTYHRRFTPKQFYEKNNHPLVVVNCTFFNFDKNQNLNMVVKEGKPIAYNTRSVKGRGKDSVSQRLIYRSAIGITKDRQADVAWILPDSSADAAYAVEHVVRSRHAPDTCCDLCDHTLRKIAKKEAAFRSQFRAWDVNTAVGGGPVLIQEGNVAISNEEEMMFYGKAINDKHPRTCVGYTNDGRLIIMVIQGRYPGIAEGATLGQEAKLLLELGCIEALNLDGGGSSCMLVNGKETIKPSEKGEERPTPAVFIIKNK